MFLWFFILKQQIFIWWNKNNPCGIGIGTSSDSLDDGGHENENGYGSYGVGGRGGGGYGGEHQRVPDDEPIHEKSANAFLAGAGYNNVIGVGRRLSGSGRFSVTGGGGGGTSTGGDIIERRDRKGSYESSNSIYGLGGRSNYLQNHSGIGSSPHHGRTLPHEAYGPGTGIGSSLFVGGGSGGRQSLDNERERIRERDREKERERRKIESSSTTSVSGRRSNNSGGQQSRERSRERERSKERNRDREMGGYVSDSSETNPQNYYHQTKEKDKRKSWVVITGGAAAASAQAAANNLTVGAAQVLQQQQQNYQNKRVAPSSRWAEAAAVEGSSGSIMMKSPPFKPDSGTLGGDGDDGWEHVAMVEIHQGLTARREGQPIGVVGLGGAFDSSSSGGGGAVVGERGQIHHRHSHSGISESFNRDSDHLNGVGGDGGGGSGNVAGDGGGQEYWSMALIKGAEREKERQRIERESEIQRERERSRSQSRERERGVVGEFQHRKTRSDEISRAGGSRGYAEPFRPEGAHDYSSGSSPTYDFVPDRAYFPPASSSSTAGFQTLNSRPSSSPQLPHSSESSSNNLDQFHHHNTSHPKLKLRNSNDRMQRVSTESFKIAPHQKSLQASVGMISDSGKEWGLGTKTTPTVSPLVKVPLARKKKDKDKDKGKDKDKDKRKKEKEKTKDKGKGKEKDQGKSHGDGQKRSKSGRPKGEDDTKRRRRGRAQPSGSESEPYTSSSREHSRERNYYQNGPEPLSPTLSPTRTTGTGEETIEELASQYGTGVGFANWVVIAEDGSQHSHGQGEGSGGYGRHEYGLDYGRKRRDDSSGSESEGQGYQRRSRDGSAQSSGRPRSGKGKGRDSEPPSPTSSNDGVGGLKIVSRKDVHPPATSAAVPASAALTSSAPPGGYFGGNQTGDYYGGPGISPLPSSALSPNPLGGLTPSGSDTGNISPADSMTSPLLLKKRSSSDSVNSSYRPYSSGTISVGAGGERPSSSRPQTGSSQGNPFAGGRPSTGGSFQINPFETGSSGNASRPTTGSSVPSAPPTNHLQPIQVTSSTMGSLSAPVRHQRSPSDPGPGLVHYSSQPQLQGHYQDEDINTFASQDSFSAPPPISIKPQPLSEAPSFDIPMSGSSEPVLTTGAPPRLSWMNTRLAPLLVSNPPTSMPWGTILSPVASSRNSSPMMSMTYLSSSNSVSRGNSISRHDSTKSSKTQFRNSLGSIDTTVPRLTVVTRPPLTSLSAPASELALPPRNATSSTPTSEVPHSIETLSSSTPTSSVPSSSLSFLSTGSLETVVPVSTPQQTAELVASLPPRSRPLPRPPQTAPPPRPAVSTSSAKLDPAPIETNRGNDRDDNHLRATTTQNSRYSAPPPFSPHTPLSTPGSQHAPWADYMGASRPVSFLQPPPGIDEDVRPPPLPPMPEGIVQSQASTPGGPDPRGGFFPFFSTASTPPTSAPISAPISQHQPSRYVTPMASTAPLAVQTSRALPYPGLFATREPSPLSNPNNVTINTSQRTLPVPVATVGPSASTVPIAEARPTSSSNSEVSKPAPPKMTIDTTLKPHLPKMTSPKPIERLAPQPETRSVRPVSTSGSTAGRRMSGVIGPRRPETLAGPLILTPPMAQDSPLEPKRSRGKSSLNVEEMSSSSTENNDFTTSTFYGSPDPTRTSGFVGSTTSATRVSGFSQRARRQSKDTFGSPLSPTDTFGQRHSDTEEEEEEEMDVEEEPERIEPDRPYRDQSFPGSEYDLHRPSSNLKPGIPIEIETGGYSGESTDKARSTGTGTNFSGVTSFLGTSSAGHGSREEEEEEESVDHAGLARGRPTSMGSDETGEMWHAPDSPKMIQQQSPNFRSMGSVVAEGSRIDRTGQGR